VKTPSTTSRTGCDDAAVRPFEELAAEAVAADVTGWDFTWLDGRATEERPPWGYARLLADRLGLVEAALDLDTGGGEVVGEAPVLPPRMVVAEGWPPNARRARDLLGPRGVDVIEVASGSALPLPDASFDLVTARHPVRPDWAEIHRVLRPGGTSLAQHVGPRSAFELIERFVGRVDGPVARDPDDEVAEAESVGLVVEDLRRATCRMEFRDVGAVIWILRKCVWWVPDFTVEAYEGTLRELDAEMRDGHPLVAHSTRHLIVARRT
jgi:SAM-dependent methyltransferase